MPIRKCSVDFFFPESSPQLNSILSFLVEILKLFLSRISSLPHMRFTVSNILWNQAISLAKILPLFFCSCIFSF